MDIETFRIDEPYLTRTLVDLVRVDSSNPALTPGAPGEAALGEVVAAAMAALGLEVVTHTLAPARVNVVGIRRGRGGGRSLLWNGHLDTVGVQGMAAPFSAEVRAGRLYGRGSQDMKGSMAAMLAAVKALNDANCTLDGDLIVAGVADEEHASLGSADLVRHYRADAAIVTEPTDLAICRAHRGFIWFTVEAAGRAAHGSRYAEGIDAIMHMGRFLAELDKLEQELRARPPHPLAGPPSLHASTIQGGTELSIYPAHCRLEIERRTVPGETVAQATQELQAICDRLQAADPTVRLTVTPFLDRDPFAVAADAPIVQVVERQLTQQLGHAPAQLGASFWTDAALLAAAGMDTVLVGPVGQGLHSAEEWVDLRSLADLAAVLAAVAREFCGGG